jgi:hypothetical protein
MREIVRALSAVAAAYAAMVTVAAAGLFLLGADGLGRLTTATVTMAGGGRIDAKGELPLAQASRLGASLRGTIDVMPLGVSLAGALVLVIAFRRPAASQRDLVVRLATAAVAFPAALTLAASAAHGRLALGRPCVRGPYGLSGCADDGRALANGITLDYHAGLGRALLGGLVWVLLVLALVALLQCRPDKGHVLSWLRTAVSVSATVILCAALALEAAGLLAAVRHGPKVVGGALLLAPNVAFAAVPAGIGVPWSVTRSTPAAPDTSRALTGVAHGPTWLLPLAFAVTVLLVIGVITAARTPVPPGTAWRLLRAGRLGPPLGVLIAGMTAVAGASAHLGVSAFGFAVNVVDVSFAGDILVALALGSAAGAVAGIIGALLLEIRGTAGRQAMTDRVRTAWNGRKTPTA